jgi:DNA-binding NarL/FixJ family response regulator
VDKTVLIVDDDPTVRSFLCVLLGQGAFRVIAQACDGIEAVSLATTYQPALVILDQEMPRMTGDAAARLLRDLVPATKVVAFTNAFAGKPDWADAFVSKDDVAELEGVLEEVVRG